MKNNAQIRRLIEALIIVPGFLGFWITNSMSFRNSFEKVFYISERLLLQAGYFMFAISVMMLILYYLQYGKESFLLTIGNLTRIKKKNTDQESDAYEDLDKQIVRLNDKYERNSQEIDELKQIFSSYKSKQFTEKNKTEIIEEITSKIKISDRAKVILTEKERLELADKIAEVLSTEKIQEYLRRIEEGYKQNSEEKKQFQILHKLNELLEPTKNRLSNEISKLGLRGNLNLVIGIGITALGLWILWDTIKLVPPQSISEAMSSADESNNFYYSMAINYLPRLSLVIFIELFAYFFLRLYKRGLDEIKYFQNEMTNVESKFMALFSAMIGGDTNLKGKVVEILGSTERNVILEKGQTTVELERAKSESKVVNDILSSIPKYFENKGNKGNKGNKKE